jgi:hypothetical protein
VSFGIPKDLVRAKVTGPFLPRRLTEQLPYCHTIAAAELNRMPTASRSST